MTIRRTLSISTIALLAAVSAARAQGASLALGAAVPSGDFSSGAGTGIDIQLQARTEPLIGPLALRIEIGYDRFAGKGGNGSTTFSGQAVSILGDLGARFYWAAGPGFYQSSLTRQINGHNVVDQRNYLGAQAAVGMDLPVFRWRGFVEAGGVKAFTQGASIVYFPLRFGVRL
jgi:hypothetical protein